MKKDTYFEQHPVYNILSYDVIVGLIQLMIDEGLVSPAERDGIYVEFKDFRNKVRPMYMGLNDGQKQGYIAYFRYRHHLFKPFIASDDKLK
ncbi:hypothetical protein BDD43_3044 [Mucilaginibacter gracilis]|uniref:Uncharacterized protein n=1 Tax=Mucilaginibacter gracilis TaxID=423350 RepID=A0A495J219_9SPHI|nr:hypothetical protein [Mucilaginibacter gracilis]RKR82853.1 hypothetical protein BDD43_3044 [Mucilaginibacter gracilis]